MPSFESVLGLLGSGLAIGMTIIIPVWAHANIFGWKGYEIVICVIAGIIGVVGTVCALIPQSRS